MNIIPVYITNATNKKINYPNKSMDIGDSS